MAVLQHHDYRNKDNQDNDGSEDYKNLTSLLLGSHHAHITKTDVEEEQNLDDIIYSSKCQVGAWFPAKLKSPPLQAQVWGVHPGPTQLYTPPTTKDKVTHSGNSPQSMQYPISSIFFWNDQQVGSKELRNISQVLDCVTIISS